MQHPSKKQLVSFYPYLSLRIKLLRVEYELSFDVYETKKKKKEKEKTLFYSLRRIPLPVNRRILDCPRVSACPITICQLKSWSRVSGPRKGLRCSSRAGRNSIIGKVDAVDHLERLWAREREKERKKGGIRREREIEGISSRKRGNAEEAMVPRGSKMSWGISLKEQSTTSRQGQLQFSN